MGAGFKKGRLLSPFQLFFIAKDRENLGKGIESSQRDGFFGGLYGNSISVADWNIFLDGLVDIFATINFHPKKLRLGRGNILNFGRLHQHFCHIDILGRLHRHFCPKNEGLEEASF
jgi:hypothetical protein